MQILFPDAFNNINDLLKPSTDIWNNNERTPIRKDQLRVPQQTFVEFALISYRKKILSAFTEESYFLYDKSSLLKESSITEINKLISIYSSIGQ